MSGNKSFVDQTGPYGQKEVDDFTTLCGMVNFLTLPAYPAIREARGDCLLAAFDSNKNHSGLQRMKRGGSGVSPADERLFPAAINAQF